MNGRDEPLMQGLEQGRRRKGMTQMLLQEIAEPTGGLQLGHPGVEVQSVDTAHLEGYVVTDQVV